MDEQKNPNVNQENENEAYDKVHQVNISSEVRTSFLSYAMSVIVQRALPDARDGLKPVQRRILYGMNDAGITASTGYKKCARIVGDVMGKYHPHGDSSIYEALVRMAQDFSYRYPLVDGHGNFGNMDGDGAAAQRYTEARMSKISMEMVRDLKKNTVDFVDNYDGEEREPTLLPAHIPNLLVNGSTGIAVGMATNIPPHNLREVIDATIAVMDNPEITIKEIMENYITGPDFPTGAEILGRSGIYSAYETGRGSIKIRSKYTIKELDNGKHEVNFTEIPYEVNKAELVKRIGDLVKNKQIEGITDLKDVSSSEGISILMEIRRDIQPEVLLNQLFQLTPLQTSYGMNMLALVNNVPRVLNLKQMLEVYVNHQIEVITRRTRFDLKVAEDRAHILEGLIKAIDHIHEIVDIITNANNDEEAMSSLINNYGLDEIQSKAIMDMQMRRLTGLQRQKLTEEYDSLIPLIADYKDILGNHSRIIEIIRNELTETKNKFGDERRTVISDAQADLEDEDLIPVENIVVTMTSGGYIKRLTLDTYRTQNRGGRGVIGMALNKDDIIEQVISMSTHDYLLCYTNLGRVYRIKGYQVPNSGRTGKGIPIVNLLNLSKDEKVRTIVPASVEDSDGYLCFVTTKGIVKRTRISEFESIRTNGKNAIALRDDDELFGVKLTHGHDEIIIAGSNGKAVRFKETDVRIMGRNASGVRGFNCDGSKVVGVAVSYEGDYILSVTQNGFGKKTPLSDYRLTKRGAKGVTTIKITDKNGELVCLRAINGNEDLLIITDSGTIIRISLAKVSEFGRNTQGVKLINVDQECNVSAVAVVESSEETPEDTQETSELKEENENA